MMTALKIITLVDLDLENSAGRDDLEDWQTLNILSSQSTLHGSRVPLKYKVAPEVPIKDAQFKVIYTLDSGRELEATTQPVDLI